jgi:serine/threonine protein kinase
MDFGTARLHGRTQGMTQTGGVVGTPEYMAPEQLLGEDVDARADIYAVGAVIYECLTGRTPHSADDPMQLISRVLEQSPAPPHELVPDVPRKLSDAVLAALHRDRGQRPRTMGELHELLVARE